MPKHPEPLVKTSVVIAQRQLDALKERGDAGRRNVSFLVREALDDYLGDVDSVEAEPESGEVAAVA